MKKTALPITATILAIAAASSLAAAQTIPSASVAPSNQAGWKLTAVDAQTGQKIEASHPFHISGTYTFAQVRNATHFPDGLDRAKAYTYRFAGLYRAEQAGVHSFSPMILGNIDTSPASPTAGPDGQPRQGEIGGPGATAGISCRTSLIVNGMEIAEFSARVRPTEGDRISSTGSIDLPAGYHPIELQLFCPVAEDASHNVSFRLSVQRPKMADGENAVVYFPETTN